MKQLRLSTAFALIAVLASAIAAWVSYDRIDRSITLVHQSKPILSVGGKSDRQTYENANTGSIHSLTVTFTEQDYPSQLFPQIEWTFRVSNGTEQHWICKGLVLRWEMNSDDGEEFQKRP